MKVIYIRTCGECPFSYPGVDSVYHPSDILCGHQEILTTRRADERAVSDGVIPPWCPLEDFVRPNSMAMDRRGA